MRTLPLLLCLACCFLPSDALSGPVQAVAVRGIVLEVECCDLLQAIHKFLVDKPTDRISLEDCRRNTRGCLSYNLIKTFVKHTRSMLDPQQKLSDSGVTTTENSLVFSLSNETLDVVSMTIFAFMGRCIATDSSMSDATKWVSYDIHRDEFYLEDRERDQQGRVHDAAPRVDRHLRLLHRRASATGGHGKAAQGGRLARRQRRGSTAGHCQVQVEHATGVSEPSESLVKV